MRQRPQLNPGRRQAIVSTGRRILTKDRAHNDERQRPFVTTVNNPVHCYQLINRMGFARNAMTLGRQPFDLLDIALAGRLNRDRKAVRIYLSPLTARRPN